MITLSRRVIRINQSKTSVRLSSLEWQAFDNLCACEQISRTALLNLLAKNNDQYQNLTAIIRIFTLCYYYSIDKNAQKSAKRAPDLNNIFNIIALIR